MDINLALALAKSIQHIIGSVRTEKYKRKLYSISIVH